MAQTNAQLNLVSILDLTFTTAKVDIPRELLDLIVEYADPCRPSRVWNALTPADPHWRVYTSLNHNWSYFIQRDGSDGKGAVVCCSCGQRRTIQFPLP